MTVKSLAVLTSGGDAPGMNAAIRAVTRAALSRGWEVYGVRHGYTGLIEGDFHPFTPRSVGGTIQQGGTILGSARCPDFMTDEGRRKALRELAQNGAEALVVIGGNGSQTGAFHLAEMGFPVVGVASTIDNDLYARGAATLLAAEVIDHDEAAALNVLPQVFDFLIACAALEPAWATAPCRPAGSSASSGSSWC